MVVGYSWLNTTLQTTIRSITSINTIESRFRKSSSKRIMKDLSTAGVCFWSVSTKNNNQIWAGCPFQLLKGLENQQTRAIFKSLLNWQTMMIFTCLNATNPARKAISRSDKPFRKKSPASSSGDKQNHPLNHKQLLTTQNDGEHNC